MSVDIYTESKIFEPTDELLINPHIGFTTQDGFNGGRRYYNCCIPESEFSDWDGDLSNAKTGYPDSSVAYCRLYWSDFEPFEGEYNFELFDRLLRLAEQRKQTLMFRFMPYRTVPAWFAEKYPEAVDPANFTAPNGPDAGVWDLDHRHPGFIEGYIRMIKAFAGRYDGHRYLDSVDIAYCGNCGEQLGVEYMSEEDIDKLNGVYLDNFKITPLISLLPDYGSENKNETLRLLNLGGKAGFRADSFGDAGHYSARWNYMYGHTDIGGFDGESYGYGHMINLVNGRSKELCGGKEMWRLGTVAFEACYAMEHWHGDNFQNTKPEAMRHQWDLDLIIDKSYEWHTSTFNNKFNPVPEEWRARVTEWLKKLGYRFTLSKIEYNCKARPDENLHIKSSWRNLGAAPLYHPWYELVYRLKSSKGEHIFISSADIREWMPGEYAKCEFSRYPAGSADPERPANKFYRTKPGVFEPAPVWETSDIFGLPSGISTGIYDLQVAIADKKSKLPAIKSANGGRDQNGWITVGGIVIA
jgi:hypothetical protein